eukprot:6851335-Ditylum_brightwellii.AAC.1
MASSDSMTEVCFNRLQRELLALTSVEDDKDHIETLPSFIKVTDQELGITKVMCKVYFDINVEYKEKAEGAEEGA